MIGKTISHYKIIEKLGEGGMGVVYKAEDTKLQRFVAIKLLPPHLSADEEATRRFIHEARAASSLDHSNIGTIYEIDETNDGQTFIAMAFYKGETLRERIDRGEVSLEEALGITMQVALGLSKAHGNGIIHRDIKPANILVTNNGIVKILDFGLAKLAGRVRITKTGTTLGTVAYMSPEQARGEPVDHRTDIWSLGVVLYEMLSGQLPFKSEYEQAVVYSILNEDPEPIKNLRSSVPMELERIIAKTLAKSENERYQHINDVLVDLRKLRKELESIISKELPSKKKPRPSIAVLPFTNLSADKEQEYFCDGMAEEIINALTHVEDLRVVARTSAFAFKGEKMDIREIGKKLNVEAVLEGSVRKAGNRLRISAQLINIADGYHLWSEKYDRNMEDVFAIQDEISLAITEKMKLKLLGEEKERMVKRYTEDLEAYNLYLKGLYFRRKVIEDDIRKAIEHFNLAINKEPDYALAYAGLAYAYMVLAFYALVSAKEAYPKAKQAALKAIELDDQLAEAHESLATVSAYLEWNWESGEREIKRAIELNPGYPWGHFHLGNILLYQARFDEAITKLQNGLDLDPLNLAFNRNLGGAYFRAGRLENAIETLQRTIEMDPTFPVTHLYLGYAYIQKSMCEEALAEMKKEKTLPKPILDTQIGIVYARMGRREEALQILSKYMESSTKEFISPYGLALLCFALEENEIGFQWLEKAYEEHDIWMFQIKIDFLMDSVRTDPRFKALLKKMGLEK